MFLPLLFLSICLVALRVHANELLPAQSTDHLRRRSLSKSYYALPFTVAWKIEMDPLVDRQPTMREYGGVARATAQWYESDVAQIYGDRRLSLYNSLCWVSGAKWKPILDVKYSHTITLDCQVTLVVNPEEDNAVPSIGQFLLDTSATSRVVDFLANYLQKSGGSPSVFQYAQDATYASYERGSYEALPDNDINEEVQTTTLEEPFQNLYAMTFDMAWNLLLEQSNQTATKDDYNLVVQSTKAWLTSSMEAYYSNYKDSFRLRQVSTQLIGTPTMEDNRHGLTVSVLVVWEANLVTSVPSPAELLKDMSSGFDLETFIWVYLASTEGPFRQPQQVSYGTSYINPNSGLALESDGGIHASQEDNTTTIVSFNMTLTYGLQGTSMETSWFGGWTPTGQEWRGLLQATQNFLQDALQQYYDNQTQATLQGVTTQWIRTQYRPWETIRPYRARLGLTLQFSSNSTLLPAAYDYKFLVSGLFASHKERYLLEYLGQISADDNQFRTVERFVWGF